MANQILEGVVTSDIQEVPEGAFMLNEGTPELSAPKTINFSFATTKVAAAGTTQTYPNGDTGSPLDIQFGLAFPQTVVRALKCPSKRRLRPLVFSVGVYGITPWATGKGLAVQDTSAFQGVLAYLPTTALQNLSVLTFPMPQALATLQITVTAYNATTGAMTFAASSMITTTLAGYPFRVVSGTGQGQVSGIISANTATVLTPTNVPAVVLDTTSVVEIPYWVASAGAGTTITASNGTFVSTALAAAGFWVVIVGGTGAGQARQITANSATVLTVATWTTNPDNTSVFLVTSNPASLGAVDLAIGNRWPVMQKGAGLAIGAYGSTFTAGSNLHVWGFGKVE